MSRREDFEYTFSQINLKDSPPLSELQNLLAELSDYFNSTEYAQLGQDDQDALQDLSKQVRGKIKDQEVMTPAPPPPASLPPAEQAEGHIPEANRMMDEAERRYYAGQYGDAIKIFDQVLHLEPTWPRALEHRKQAEDYLREGHIPAIALPPEAATAYGKAQSAARVGRYEAAAGYLETAKSLLHQSGITRWADGLDFENKLNAMIEAESVFKEGIHQFNQGQVDDAITTVDTAYQASGIPRHKDLADKYRQFKNQIQKLSGIFYSGTTDPKLIAQATRELDALVAEYGDHPKLGTLRTQLDIARPRVAEELRGLIARARISVERASNLDNALAYAKEAQSYVEQARSVGLSDDALTRTQNDISQMVSELENQEEQLQQAGLAYTRSKTWPVSAWRMSQEVRNRFPNDPKVVALNQKLASYRQGITLVKAGIGLVVLILLTFLVMRAWNSYQRYIISLTPTATLTPTLTPTWTLTPTLTYTPTPTLTPTFTPSPTLTFTPTPTPIVWVTYRAVWARNDCYEAFTAIGKIPEGALVRLLPPPTEGRRFDNLSRECVLVEYQGPDKSVLGWVLLQDLGPSNP